MRQAFCTIDALNPGSFYALVQAGLHIRTCQLAMLIAIERAGSVGGEFAPTFLCRDARRESDLEQPLLEEDEKDEAASYSAAQTGRNGHARSEASETAGCEAEAAPARGGVSTQSVWRDPVLPATVAAVLCLWVLKLVQQGYVDGKLPGAYKTSYVLPLSMGTLPGHCLIL